MYDAGIYSIDKKTMSVFCQLQRKYYKKYTRNTSTIYSYGNPILLTSIFDKEQSNQKFCNYFLIIVNWKSF